MPVTIGGSGPITGVTSINTTVSDTELGYLDGVTSAVQTQINTAGGLVKITDQTFSAASSVSVNNCFSSTYDNYTVEMTFTASAGTELRWRWRASGSDNTTSDYHNAIIEWANTTVQATRYAGYTYNYLQYLDGSGYKNAVHLNIYDPNKAAATGLQSFANRTISGSSAIIGMIAFDSHAAATSFDGFTLYPASGNITGTLRVYGYRN